ncbi:MFS transporter [Actinomycetospora sp. NBRC 106378]|uniref:MFS transporter n=1 Tax=Actinomycetospora sp. NBRC 106378 TaxID=3032208 RepID=UPI0024A0EA32|nr:MFS transporter [Actinomycetospora sp. NBRC 106378]GLZ55567.1 MFS transporter [Actinomycetospora sp. NBRC 106378]
MTGRADERTDDAPRWAFGAVSLSLLVLGAAAGAPAPLYVAYEHRYGISPSGLTGAFAIYIVPLAAMLLIGGRLSDHLGRRPVAAVALLLDAVACGVFTQVDSSGVLLLARSIQGLATGLGLAAIAAFVVDLGPPRRPGLAGAVAGAAAPGGLATGALVSGVLVAVGPAPLVLVYLVFAGLLALAAVAVLLAPETARPGPGALRSLRPSLHVPAGAGPLFATACLCFVASWALAGYYQALGPSVAADVLGATNPLVGGLVLASLTGTSGIAGLAVSGLPHDRVMLGGLAALLLGVSGVVGSAVAGSTAGFFVASVVAGVGFGASFTGAMRWVLADRSTSERAGLLAAAYLVSYIGSAVPSYLVGFLVPAWGLLGSTVAYGALVAALALVSAAAALTLRTRTRARA